MNTSPNLWQALRANAGLALAIFISVIGCVAAVTLLADREYRSEAKLFLRMGRENAGVDAITAVSQPQLIASPVSREEELNSVVEIISSRKVLGELVDTVGPEVLLGESQFVRNHEALQEDRLAQGRPAGAAEVRPVGAFTPAASASGLSNREAAIMAAAKRLRVGSERKSLIVSVSYDGPSPELAQTILNTIINIYERTHTQMHRPTGAHEFLQEEADSLKQRLVESEGRLNELRNKTGLASIEQQRGQLITRIGNMRDELLKAEAELIGHQRAIDNLTAAMARVPAERLVETTRGAQEQGMAGMRQKLFELQMEEQRMAAIYTDEMVLLRNKRQELDELKKLLALEPPDRTELTTAPNKVYEELHLSRLLESKQQAALESEANQIREQLADAEAELVVLNEQALKIDQTAREVAMLDAAYRRYADNVEQARMEEAIRNSHISNLSVAQPPTLPARPVRPRPLINGVLGLFAATCAAMGTVWLKSRRRPQAPTA